MGALHGHGGISDPELESGQGHGAPELTGFKVAISIDVAQQAHVHPCFLAYISRGKGRKGRLKQCEHNVKARTRAYVHVLLAG